MPSGTVLYAARFFAHGKGARRRAWPIYPGRIADGCPGTPPATGSRGNLWIRRGRSVESFVICLRMDADSAWMSLFPPAPRLRLKATSAASAFNSTEKWSGSIRRGRGSSTESGSQGSDRRRTLCFTACMSVALRVPFQDSLPPPGADHPILLRPTAQEAPRVTRRLLRFPALSPSAGEIPSRSIPPQWGGCPSRRAVGTFGLGGGPSRRGSPLISLRRNEAKKPRGASNRPRGSPTLACFA